MCNIKGIIYHIIRLIKILVKEYLTNRKIRSTFKYIKEKIRSALKRIKELSLLQDFQNHKKKDEEERNEKDKRRILEKLEFQDPNV